MRIDHFVGEYGVTVCEYGSFEVFLKNNHSAGVLFHIDVRELGHGIDYVPCDPNVVEGDYELNTDIDSKLMKNAVKEWVTKNKDSLDKKAQFAIKEHQNKMKRKEFLKKIKSFLKFK